MHCISVTILFVFLTIGHLNAQLSFYANLLVDYKVSFTNYYNGSQLLGSDTRYEQFHLYAPRKTFKDPRRMGVGFGVQYKRHNVQLSVQNNGVSSYFKAYFKRGDSEPGIDAYSPMRTFSKTVHRKFALDYAFYILKKEKKTNFFVSGSLGLHFRLGPKGEHDIGKMGFAGSLGGSTYFSNMSEAYTTNDKFAFGWGIGMGADIYIKGLYILTLSCNYLHANNGLNRMKLKFTIGDAYNEYNYEIDKYPINTSISFGISRRFQLYPWKPLKSNPVIKFFGDRVKSS